MPCRILGFATVAFLCALATAPAMAIAQRTFVASNGNDANPCSLTQPCRSFAAGILQTSSGGEVIVLDSAGYGPVTIAQSVSIIAPPGVYAGISVFAGSGLFISISDVVVLVRGVTIVGQDGPDGRYGINVGGDASVTVQDCEISHMTHGITAIAGRVTVKNTVLRDNVVGMYERFGTTAALDGILAEGNSLIGVWVSSGGAATITNSVMANNGTAGVFAETELGFSPAVTSMTVIRSTISGSTYGALVRAEGAGTSRVVVDSTAINDTTAGAFFFAGGGGTEVIYSSGTNTVGFNNGTVVGGTLTFIGTL